MTYSQLLYYLKGLAQSAPLVNTVTKGEVASLDLDKANIYQMVHIDISEATFNSGMAMSYSIAIACLQQRDLNSEPVEDKFWRQDNEVDNHNETMVTLQLIWSQIYRDWQDLYISAEDDAVFEKITFEKGNILDGWELRFIAQVPFSVDLCVDPSYGAEMILNGNFASGSDDWTSGSGAGELTIIDEEAYIGASGTAQQLGLTIENGKKYKFEIMARVTASGTMQVEGVSGIPIITKELSQVMSTIVTEFIANDNGTGIRISEIEGGSNMIIDNVSLKEIL